MSSVGASSPSSMMTSQSPTTMTMPIPSLSNRGNCGTLTMYNSSTTVDPGRNEHQDIIAQDNHQDHCTCFQNNSINCKADHHHQQQQQLTKQLQTELQRKDEEIEHYKVMVKKLFTILADTAAADAAREKRRSHRTDDRRQITDSTKLDDIRSKKEACSRNDTAAISRTAIESQSPSSSKLEQTRENDSDKKEIGCTNKSSSSLQKQKQSKEEDTESTVSMTENTSFDSSEDDGDHRSVPSTSRCSSANSSHSSFDSLRRPTKVISLPVSTVSEKCPRKRNQRVLVNGQWGQLSGPTAHQGSTSKGACVLQGCVVRFEGTHELYVGSLNRLDTGSFTFHHPGTLYNSQGSPVRRVR